MKTLLLTSSALTLAVSLTAAQAQSTAPATQAPPAQNTTRPAPASGGGALNTARPAQTSAPGTQMIQAPPASPQRISSGVLLSDFQRLRISQALASERGLPTSVAIQLTAGTQVPQSVRLKSVPPEVVAISHEYGGKSFFVTPDAVVIVNPRSREIISAFSFADQETALVPVVTQNAVTLSPEQREIVRREVAPGASAGPAPLVRPRLAAVGDEVPGSIALEEFPPSVSGNIPQLKTYRYYRLGQEVVIVDPDKRRVLEVIQ